MTEPRSPVHHKVLLESSLSFKGNLGSVQTLRTITRYSLPWLLLTAALALVGILVSPALPYWGSIVLGLAVAAATFITGGLAAARVIRQIERDLH